MKTWSCKNKQDARQNTIIDLYRLYFCNALPSVKQYWTTCGLCFNTPGSELDQMLQSGLITPEQFYGVDRKEDIIEQNKKLVDSHWFHGDFIDQIQLAEDFNPGIIDVDIIHLKKKGSVYLGRLLSYLTDIDVSDFMVVANMMLCNPHHGIEIYDGNEIIEEMSKVNSFQYAWLSGKWRLHPDRFEYVGQQYGTRTILASYIFIRE